jgi:hypothetical protein
MIILDPGTLGGLLLILGAYALFKGKVFYSVFIYFLADIMWAILAYQAGDIFGTFAIAIGMLLGLGVFYKMNSGIFIKDLKNE